MKKAIIYFLIVLIITVIAVSIAGYYFYTKIYNSNVSIDGKSEVSLYIPTNSTYEQVLDSLYGLNIITDKISLEWVIKQKNYHNLVKSGCYTIKNNMSNNELVDLLRSGNQTSVKVTFNNVRLKEDLAGKVAKNIELDSITILEALNNKDFIEKYGFNMETILIMFLPDTYEFNWNTSLSEFFDKMQTQYNKFWNETRMSKLEQTGLSKEGVSVLASIVQAEQSIQHSEQYIIAGLYINRIQRGIPLQSDPTLIYANKDFTIKRVYNWHKEIKSPYNTYQNVGLPPGPINLPEKRAIDAVLDFDKNNYIYMCAKEDFSGYHYFTNSLAQHNIYARRYQNAATQRGIK